MFRKIRRSPSTQIEYAFPFDCTNEPRRLHSGAPGQTTDTLPHVGRLRSLAQGQPNRRHGGRSLSKQHSPASGVTTLSGLTGISLARFLPSSIDSPFLAIASGPGPAIIGLGSGTETPGKPHNDWSAETYHWSDAGAIPPGKSRES